jgi:hypothetical protein
MSAGSGASNLGYGNITPNSNINGRFVNPDNSHSPGPFGSNQIPGLPGLAGAKNNIDAALGYVPGICFKGGAKHFKNKIKKISNKYKMKSKKFTKRMKSRIRSAFLRKSKTTRKTRRRRRSRSRTQRGGYSQYQNNQPMTTTYSVGGLLKAGDSGLANPPPHTVLPNCTNCMDNANHFTGMGFASRGH